MTLEEMKQKWCPFVRAEEYGGANMADPHKNRSVYMGSLKPPIPNRCIGLECMACKNELAELADCGISTADPKNSYYCALCK